MVPSNKPLCGTTLPARRIYRVIPLADSSIMGEKFHGAPWKPICGTILPGLPGLTFGGSGSSGLVVPAAQKKLWRDRLLLLHNPRLRWIADLDDEVFDWLVGTGIARNCV